MEVESPHYRNSVFMLGIYEFSMQNVCSISVLEKLFFCYLDFRTEGRFNPSNQKSIRMRDVI